MENLQKVKRVSNRTIKDRRILLCFVYICLLIFASAANAILVPLEVFTNNGLYGDSMNLYVAVTDAGSGQVDFTFHNENTFTSSIKRIYFDDGILSGIAAITEGPGTDFDISTTPSDLPSGNKLGPPFETTEGFSVGAEPSPAHNGINPGEWLTITFNLKSGKIFSDVVSNLQTNTLRIGVHVISLPDGSSEAAVTPEPATICLLAVSSLFILRKRRF